MPGPYFPNQKRNECGCYYPDAMRVCDIIIDIEKRIVWRVIACKQHGIKIRKLNSKTNDLERLTYEDMEKSGVFHYEQEREKCLIKLYKRVKL